MGKGTKTVLVVDDDISTLKMVEQFLALKKYDVTPCLTYRDATKEMAEGKFDAAILDYFMPDTTGLEMMKAFHQIDPAMPVIILTAARDIKIAVTAIKEGAFNYQVKPVDPDELYGNLSNAIETKRLTTENLRLKNDLTERHRFRLYHRLIWQDERGLRYDRSRLESKVDRSYHRRDRLRQGVSRKGSPL